MDKKQSRKSNKERLKEVVRRVNNTLNLYESNYTSVQTTPHCSKERMKTLEQFIISRFNFEAYEIEEFRDLLDSTNGALFELIELTEPDEERRRYGEAVIGVADVRQILEGCPELDEEIERVYNFIGGTRLRFNDVKLRVRLTIEKDEN